MGILWSIVITLFLIFDPFGNIPTFYHVLKKLPPKRQAFIIAREMVIAFFILIFFLFFGKYVLDLLGITQPAITISGGVILFIIALQMIFPHFGKGEGDDDDNNEEPVIVPLAVPLISGPTSIAMVILYSSQYPDQRLILILAIFIAWFVSSLILLSSSLLQRLLGDKMLTAITRLMGIILTTMAIQMFLSGIGAFLKNAV